MNTVIRHIVSRTYRPLLSRYLSASRLYRYQGVSLQVPPQVFHPGFFFSTKLLLHCLSAFDVQGKSVLELGCGSGLISIAAAKRGAVVTATDINPIAIEALRMNAPANDVKIRVIESDLFEKLPATPFDFILINPPYYKKNPRSFKDFAWYCGENGEFFSGLFSGLKNYIHSGFVVLMVTFEGCDMQMISGFAGQHGFELHCIFEKQNLLEKNFVYQISF